jgi:uncharacterized protein YjbI with pentapeptide repeats
MGLERADFSWANLRLSKLRNCLLDRANFRGTDLEGADLSNSSAMNGIFSRAQLRQTSFVDSNLKGSTFTSAQFRKSQLKGANFKRAIHNGAKISRCSLENADFSEAQLYETAFLDLNLTHTSGLATCNHRGPSIIDHRTLMRSPGLPKSFLRGCGLSDWEIVAVDLYRQDLSAKEVIDVGYRVLELRNVEPIQYFSCFISYSHQDKTFAQQLHDALQDQGIRCWLDEKRVRPGDDIFEAIDEGLRLWDKVLLCCVSFRQGCVAAGRD